MFKRLSIELVSRTPQAHPLVTSTGLNMREIADWGWLENACSKTGINHSVVGCGQSIGSLANFLSTG